MIITTGPDPTEAQIAKAKVLASELQGSYYPRRNETLKGLCRKVGDSRIMVASKQELVYYEGDLPPLYFHPSMAFVRVKRLRKGESDPLIEVSGCRRGDQVLDCTAGLCSDALVFSYAAGPDGGVTALESEAVLHAVVRDGLKNYDTGMQDVNEALRRIRLIRTGHEQFLAELPDRSVDIVYFDPMFRVPISESSGIEPLRPLANVNALTKESIEHALRAARKAVVLKENRESGEFERLAFPWKLKAAKTKVAYGVITIE